MNLLLNSITATFCFLSIVFSSTPCKAQSSEPKPRRFTYELRIGANVNLYRGLLNKSGLGKQLLSGNTGIKLFLSGLVNIESKQWILAYGPTVSLYSRSLGNSQDPLDYDIQFDLVNSFSAGFGLNKTGNMKYLRTIGNSSAYNLRHEFNHAIVFTGNYILNNHHRNQTVGAINITFADRFSILYYNDGGPPIANIGSGDNMDRWWTGGGGIFVHPKQRDGSVYSQNYIELTFDQFTGYTPLLYELSNVLGMNIPKYSQSNHNKLGKYYTSELFNSSSYNLKVAWPSVYPVAFDIGVIGSLVEDKGNGKKLIFGVQDIIHAGLGFILHPNRDDTRLYFGATYNSRLYEK
ncbi:MAG: hypothetical protein IPH93_13905 [Saprospiraceae bacterium]|nr:hypothetical protein [Saprospiraceae bacterium]MBK7810952.1 hypothetical protein [Saprospiraceae bacterium]MBK9630556.1 hypothetical protein [Saprospiraceae bacterium]